MSLARHAFKHWGVRFILLVLACFVCPSIASTVWANTDAIPSAMMQYVVQPGDTLSAIARRFCGDYRAMARANRIADPDRIYAGRTVLRFNNGCPTYAPSVLEKQIVSLRGLTGNSEASSGKLFPPSEAEPLPLIRLARKPARFTSADLATIKRSQVASCQMAGNQQKRWATRISDIAACIRRLHGEHIREAATQYDLSEKLIIAVMIKESEGNPNAVSSSRCLGLMQLLPSTARGYGIDLAQIFDPRTNILAGARVLHDYGVRKDLDFGLAAYNLGPGAVNRRMKHRGFNPSAFDYTVKVKNILRLL